MLIKRQIKIPGMIAVAMLLSLSSAWADSGIGMACLAIKDIRVSLVCSILLDGGSVLLNDWREGRIGGCLPDINRFIAAASECEQRINDLEGYAERRDSGENSEELRRRINGIIQAGASDQARWAHFRRRIAALNRGSNLCWSESQNPQMQQAFNAVDECYRKIPRLETILLRPGPGRAPL